METIPVYTEVALLFIIPTVIILLGTIAYHRDKHPIKKKRALSGIYAGAVVSISYVVFDWVILKSFVDIRRQGEYVPNIIMLAIIGIVFISIRIAEHSLRGKPS